MNSEKMTQSHRGTGISSLVFGILGGVFFWWVPLGMVLSLTGLLLGLIDWTMAQRRSLDYRLSIVAIVLAVLTLSLNFAIAALGWQTITFGSLR